MLYDYVIIGCGFCGLLCSYRLNKMGYKVISFEASKDIGGRALEKEINGVRVKVGGGIVDLDNSHLINLLSEMNIKVNKSKQIVNDSYLPGEFDIDDAIEKIKSKYFELDQCLNMNVDQFLSKYFGEEFKQLYYTYTEFNDYKYQDINDYILRYPIEDDCRGEYDFYYFSYRELAKKLATNIIHEKVISIKRQIDQTFLINDYYQTKNIINCVTIDEAKKLYSYSFLNEIGTVPFCRIYTYHTQNLDMVPNDIIILNNECKKMIKTNERLLMAVYCDSENALFWKDKMEKNIIVETLREKLPFLPPISEYMISFWKNGVHYFKPNHCNTDKYNMRKIWLLNHMNPEKGIYFAGEYFSERCGYVEGAISSADFLFENFFANM